MEIAEYIISILFIVIGSFSLIASLLDVEWFFTSRRASTVVHWMGRMGARLFYGLLGLALIACGILAFYLPAETTFT